MQFIEGLAIIQIPYYEVNVIHGEVSCHLEKVWKDIFIENKGDYKKWGYFMRADSSVNHIVFPSWYEANISEGLISRSPIKHKTVLVMASGWMEIVKQLPCWSLTVFSLIGHWDYGNHGYPRTGLLIIYSIKQERERAVSSPPLYSHLHTQKLSLIPIFY